MHVLDGVLQRDERGLDLGHGLGLRAAEGFLHDFEGLVIFMASTAVLILEVVVLASCYAASVLPGYNATLLIAVFTTVLLMLWSILDAAENCSRAFCRPRMMNSKCAKS